jgi:hypothetical protein
MFYIFNPFWWAEVIWNAYWWVLPVVFVVALVFKPKDI